MYEFSSILLDGHIKASVLGGFAEEVVPYDWAVVGNTHPLETVMRTYLHLEMSRVYIGKVDRIDLYNTSKIWDFKIIGKDCDITGKLQMIWGFPSTTHYTGEDSVMLIDPEVRVLEYHLCLWKGE